MLILEVRNLRFFLFCYFGKKSMQFHLTKYNFC